MASTVQTQTRSRAQKTTAQNGRLTADVSKGPQFPDIQTIRNAIPAHCFESSVLTSMSYVVRDVAIAAALMWAALTYIPQIENATWRFAAWMAYGYVQGLVGVGIWILAHEAGHGAFSKHDRFNNVVGWVLHSSLLVPFFSWKYSHHRHHRFTGHMEKDMAFVPQTIDQRSKRRIAQLYLDPDLVEDTPAFQLIQLIFHQLAGWQAYLLFNVSSGPDSKQKEASWWRQSHFEPTSAVFRPNEAIFIAISDLGLAITFGALWYASKFVGWSTIGLLYFVPYFWVQTLANPAGSHWLVAITYLHHHDSEVPHYEADSWTFVKGALATIDRDYGFIGKHVFHGIIDTHVVHHLFPRIPFYKAEEATEAIKPLLGDLYHRNDKGFMGQLWTTFTTCRYVEKDPKVPGAMRWSTKD